MLVTDDGITRLANALHPTKTEHPMLVTELPMVTLLNEMHLAKA